MNAPYEDDFSPGEVIRFEVREVLCDERTPFQSVQIVDLVAFGRSLILDGNLQSTTDDEHHYHEPLVHPAMLLVDDPGPKSVLILGGGEGATLREALCHRSVERAVMADLDERVVMRCREFLPDHHQGAFEDPRVELRFADADAFLRSTRERFDVIVFDVVDPGESGPAAHLFEEPFFAEIKDHLHPDGVFSMQYGAAFGPDLAAAARVVARLGRVFEEIRLGRVFVPSYHGAWGTLVAGRDLRPFEPAWIDEHLASRVTAPRRAIDGASVVGQFALPKDVREALARADTD